MNKSNSFPKAERIFLQREIDFLFKDSHSFVCYPLRILYCNKPEESIIDPKAAKASVLISVPKKKIRKAVHRNRLKRQIREAYRLNKHRLLEHLAENTGLLISFIYLDKELTEYAVIEKSINKAFDILIAKTQ